MLNSTTRFLEGRGWPARRRGSPQLTACVHRVASGHHPVAARDRMLDTPHRYALRDGGQPPSSETGPPDTPPSNRVIFRPRLTGLEQHDHNRNGDPDGDEPVAAPRSDPGHPWAKAHSVHVHTPFEVAAPPQRRRGRYAATVPHEHHFDVEVDGA